MSNIITKTKTELITDEFRISQSDFGDTTAFIISDKKNNPSSAAIFEFDKIDELIDSLIEFRDAMNRKEIRNE